MNCSRELIEGYIDEELDLGRKLEVEEHLFLCDRCSTACSRIRQRQLALRTGALHYTAPAGLEQSIRNALQESVRKEAPKRSWRLLAIAASLLLAASLAWNLSQLTSRSSEGELLAQNLLSSHVRSVIGNHMLDVVSSDQHTVKPWFNGKLDFSPDVRDFAAQGFPLIGGRLDYLSGRPVAALVYQRRKHVINVFTWPHAELEEAPRNFSRNGYNGIHWSDGAMTFWAVSDLSSTELEQFANLHSAR